MKHFFKTKYILIVMMFVLFYGALYQEEELQKSINVNSQVNDEVMVCGYPIGVYLKYDGILVARVGTFYDENSICVSPSRSKLQQGDIITAVNGKNVDDKMTFSKYVEEYGEEDMILTVKRNNEEIEVKLKPHKDKEGNKKLGIWVRDDTQGIGTLTYIKTDGSFGALGHGINDIDTGNIIPIKKGALYEAMVVDIKKGENGNPGEFIGAINYNNKYKLGSINLNSKIGIYGKFDGIPQNEKLYKVAKKYEIEVGTAYIVSYVEGERKEYEIKITDVDVSDEKFNKGIEFQVTDKALLAITNGIVQGMSGSPIVQNGRIVGAVTHVLVNDPTRGYGIFIENMLAH